MRGKCTLPQRRFDRTSDLSFYNVVAADYNKNPVTHALTDTADIAPGTTSATRARQIARLATNRESGVADESSRS